jgi:hypothetical protein
MKKGMKWFGVALISGALGLGGVGTALAQRAAHPGTSPHRSQHAPGTHLGPGNGGTVHRGPMTHSPGGSQVHPGTRGPGSHGSGGGVGIGPGGGMGPGMGR